MNSSELDQSYSEISKCFIKYNSCIRSLNNLHLRGSFPFLLSALITMAGRSDNFMINLVGFICLSIMFKIILYFIAFERVNFEAENFIRSTAFMAFLFSCNGGKEIEFKKILDDKNIKKQIENFYSKLLKESPSPTEEILTKEIIKYSVQLVLDNSEFF